MAILSVCFLSELALWGGGGGGGGVSLFSQVHGRWRSCPGQPAQAARPDVRVYGICAVCRCLLVRIMVAYSSAV